MDWDNFAISVLEKTPLDKTSDDIANSSDSNANDSKSQQEGENLFNKPYFDECKKELYEPTKPEEKKVFQKKFMNIIDPLRDHNNLGTSISKNQFMRIRRAFQKGHDDLKKIWDGTNPIEDLVNEFFRNTIRENKKSGRWENLEDSSDELTKDAHYGHFKNNLDHARNCLKKKKQKKRKKKH